VPNIEKLSNNNEKSGIDIESNNKEVIPKNMEQQKSPEAQKISSSDEQLVLLEKKIESTTIRADSESETVDTKAIQSVVDNKIGSLVEKQKELDRKQDELNERRRIIEELKLKLDAAQNEINDKQIELDKRREDLIRMKSSLEDRKKDMDNAQKEIDVKKNQCQAEVVRKQKEFEEKKLVLSSEQKNIIKIQADIDFDQKAKDRRQNLINMNKKQIEADEQKLSIENEQLYQQQQTLISELRQLDTIKKTPISGTKNTGPKQSESDSDHKNLQQKLNS
jgi:chromosome segregation ATPase